MKVLAANDAERKGFLQGDYGYLVRSGTYVIAYVAWSVQETPTGKLFYAHSLQSMGAECSERATAMLFQRMRKTARSLGFKTINFYVAPEQPALMRLAESGRARIKQVWMEMDA